MGEDVTRVAPMQRCIAGVGRSFQIPQPFDKLTVFENLLVAATHGRPSSEGEAGQACAEILERTELIGSANVLAGSLSLLQRKRLELARAMATEPKLLLLDEIAGGLTEGECIALVTPSARATGTGVTIIVDEHVAHASTACSSGCWCSIWQDSAWADPENHGVKGSEEIYSGASKSDAAA